MSNIKITIDSAQFARYLAGLPGKVDKGIQRGVYRGALLIEREAKKLISRGYFKHPTGRLMNSISVDLYPLSAEISPHVYYAEFVHDGTRYIRPHPFMTDTAQNFESQVHDLIEESIQSSLI